MTKAHRRQATIDEIRAVRKHDEARHRFGRENAGKICKISACYVCLCGNPKMLEFEIGEASDAFQTRRIGPVACSECDRRYVLTAYVSEYTVTNRDGQK